jgi:hypothetical protein
MKHTRSLTRFAWAVALATFVSPAMARAQDKGVPADKVPVTTTSDEARLISGT